MSEFDVKNPFTPEQVEGFKNFFRSLPTYNPVGRYALSSDLKEMVIFLKMTPVEERTEGYKKFWDAVGGKVYEDIAIPMVMSSHDNVKMSRLYADAFDVDKNGFISPSEFETMIKVMIVHDSRTPNVGFEQFLKEADTNADGKVSIDEATDWIQKQLDRKQ